MRHAAAFGTGRIPRNERSLRASVRDTEGTFDPEVDRVPAGRSVAQGGGPAPIPGPPRGPGEDPRGSRCEDFAEVGSVVVAAADDGVGPRGRPSRTRQPILDIRRPPPPPRGGRARAGGARASG